MFEDRMEEILFTSRQIEEKVEELANKISNDYQGKTPILIGILKGAFIFLADLSRKLSIPHVIEFMDVSSYGDQTESSGIVKIEKDLDRSVAQKDIILVDDIIDTGLTLQYLKEHFKPQKPSSIKLCTLLSKPEKRQVDLESDYLGFTIPDKFVVGYGLGHQGLYRNLNYIGILKKEFH